MSRPFEPFHVVFQINCRTITVSITIADMIHKSITIKKALVLIQQLLLGLYTNLDHVQWGYCFKRENKFE